MKNVISNYHVSLVKILILTFISYLLLQSQFLFALDKIYWVNQRDKKIQRSNLDGSNMESIITSGLDRPFGLAIDHLNGKIYWTDWALDRIKMANLDGSGVTTIISSGLATPLYIVVDPQGGKVYWTDSNKKTINRANLDGSNSEAIVSGLNSNPCGIDLDITGGKVYWSAFGPGTAEGVIQRANLDGSQVETITSAIEPNGLALDVTNNKIYWVNDGFVSGGYYVPAPQIWWSDLNGSNKKKLLSQGTGSTFLPKDLAIDSNAGKIYWTESVSSGWEKGYEKIMRANLNGSNVEALITDIAGDPTPIGIALLLNYTPINIIANFIASPTSGTAPLTVQFTDQSTGSITSRSWDFGDGQTSTSTNPSHTYQNAGTYTVKLTVTGLGGSNTKTRTNYINVSSPSTPVANFYGTPTSGTAPLTVQFTDQSTGDITSRSWDFGDGQTSTSTNPSHSYQNAGTYTVKLTVTGPGGSNTKYRNNYIEVFSTSTNLIKNPEFDQGMNDWYKYVDPRDAQYTFSIDNNSVLSGRNSLKVDITKAGSVDWYITLFAFTPIQQNDYYEVRFKAKLVGAKRKGFRIRFQQGQSPWYDYGGLAITINDTTENYGPFYIKANTTDINARFNFHFGGGQTNNIIIYLDAIHVAKYIPGPPVPEFSATPLSGEAPLSVKFNDESTGLIHRRKWDFGDGKTSTAQNPSHTYQEPGIYDVNLTIIGVSGDTVNLLKGNYITVGTTSVQSGDTNNKLLGSFSLEQNYPNPFNPETNINFYVPIESNVLLTIYNLNGENVFEIFKGRVHEGHHSFIWNASNFPTGTYFIRMQTDKIILTKKCILIK